MSESNKQVTRRFWEEVWNRRNLDAIDDLFTEDFILHISGADFAGRDQIVPGLTSQWLEPFPDISAQLNQQVAERDRVADLLVFSGTHNGAPFRPGLFHALGLPAIPATNQSFRFTQSCISRVEGGRIAEMWEDFDRVRLFLQVGVELLVPDAESSGTHN